MMVMLKKLLLPLLACCVLSGAELRTVCLKNNGESGKTGEEKIQLAPGECVQLQLQSNPTTGYDWEFFLTVSGVVEVVKNEFKPGNTQLCGAPGMRLLTLKAVKKGSGKLLGFYRRSWEKFDPAKEQSSLVTLIVK